MKRPKQFVEFGRGPEVIRVQPGEEYDPNKREVALYRGELPANRQRRRELREAEMAEPKRSED